MRTAFFVDGYNLFYGLLEGTDCKWLDLPSLLAYLLKAQDSASSIASIDYFTSMVKPDLASRGIVSLHAQQTYIRALKARGVNVHEGRHQLDTSRAPRYVEGEKASRQNWVNIWRLEEKETDVNMAISMYRMATKQAALPPASRVEQIVLVSADTDLTPALRAIREDFPEIRIGVILPHRTGIKREPPGSLQNNSHWMRRHVSLDELRAHRFPERVPTKKKPADKPDYW